MVHEEWCFLDDVVENCMAVIVIYAVTFKRR